MINYFLHCIEQHHSITAECSSCDIETVFSGVMWFRTDEGKFIQREYQCQDCGQLKYSDKYSHEGITVALSEKCKCGGQYRSDKNIFCPNCHHRKTSLNKTENYNHIDEEQDRLLRIKHGE